MVAVVLGAGACVLGAAEFRIESIDRQSSRGELRFSADTGFYYILSRGNSVTDIRLATDLAWSSGAQILLADTNTTNTAQFYRVEKIPLTSLRDTDGDGICDAWELLHRRDGAALNGEDAEEDQNANGVADSIDALRESLRAGAVRGRPVLAAGAYHTLAVKRDGTLWGWGDNIAGELGSIAFTETNSPAEIGVATNWIAAAAAGLSSYGLKSDGTLWAWGQSPMGTIFVPTQIGTNTDWIGLPSGSPFNKPTALRADGSRWQFTPSYTNAQSLGASNGWAAVMDDQFNGHWAIKDDGTLWFGTSVFDTNPVWTSVSVGVSQGFGIRTNGTLWAWVPSCCSTPTEGELGLGSNSPSVPTQVGTDTWASVTAGIYHSAGIKSDGSLWWWGANFGYQPDGAAPTSSNVPTQFGTHTDWISVAAGSRHTVAMRADGTVWTFGENELGKRGNGTIAILKVPARIGIDHDWSAVAVGVWYSFGLKTNGTLWGWGMNRYGALGVGDFSSMSAPRQVPGSNWIAISGGNDHTTALQSDGTLWVWGKYTYSGTINDVFTNVPTRLGFDLDWAKISAGFQHSLALKNDGSVWSWGRNVYGELGFWGASTSNPTHVGSAFWADISAGYYNSLAVQNVSSLWSGGKIIGSPVGGGGFSQVDFDFGWKSVANAKRHSLFSHALALKRNGTVWAWGSNSRGQLGTNTTSSSPVQVGTATNWSHIAVGDLFSSALKTDGTLWMTGFNFYGQLGFGTRADTNLFTRVGIETNWTSIAAGYRHMLALKADGSIWAWGDNSSGQCAQPALFEPSPVAGSDWGPPRR